MVVTAHEVEAVALRGHPLAVGVVDDDICDVDTAEKIVGKGSSVVARNFDLLEDGVCFLRFFGREDERPHVGSHPEVAHFVAGYAAHIPQVVHRLPILVDESGERGDALGGRINAIERRTCPVVVDQPQRVGGEKLQLSAVG